MTSMNVPELVMSLAVSPVSKDSGGQFSKALNRLQREDPTFRVGLDAESGQTISSGMGELHLDIYVERIRREYKRLMLQLENLVLTSERPLLNVLNLIIYIRSKLEGKVNMEEYVGTTQNHKLG